MLNSLGGYIAAIVTLFVTVFGCVLAIRVTSRKETPVVKNTAETIDKTNKGVVEQIVSKNVTLEQLSDIDKNTSNNIENIKSTPVGEKVGLDDTEWNKDAGGVKR